MLLAVGALACARNAPPTLDDAARPQARYLLAWSGDEDRQHSDHFSVFVPMGRAINPVTHTNWEGTGVAPDVRVAADSALGVAHALALQAMLARHPDAERERDIRRALDELSRSSR